MTREEAIKLLECSATELVGMMMQTDEQTAIHQIQRYVDACDMAIAALREQDSNANQHVSNTSNALESFNQKTEADTVKGCKLCNSARFDIAVQTRDQDDMYVFSSDPVIGAMFCPLCGRRLEEV